MNLDKVFLKSLLMLKKQMKNSLIPLFAHFSCYYSTYLFELICTDGCKLRSGQLFFYRGDTPGNIDCLLADLNISESDESDCNEKEIALLSK